MRIFKSFLAFLFLILSQQSFSQERIDVSLMDTLDLELVDYSGELNWQHSTDSLTWEDIENANTGAFQIIVLDVPSYYRAKVEVLGCSITYFSRVLSVYGSNVSTEDDEDNEPEVTEDESEVTEDESDDPLPRLWSDPETWGGTKPVAGEDVAIEGKVILDESPPALGVITINGILQFDRKDLQLTAENILLKGSLRIGTANEPFEQKALVTLNGSNNQLEQNDRGIMAMGGSNLELHGATPNVLWTKLNQHLELNSKELELEEGVNWAVGDEIVMAPTDYYEAGNGNIAVTQKVEITSVTDNTLTIADGSNSHRWGRLQYATDAGLSINESDVRVTPPVPDTPTEKTPTILDERAEIGYLTRNIQIQSSDDELWQNFGFGSHIMIMPDAKAHVEGVEIIRGGQRGHIRRYPFHWHNLSYATPNTLDDATGQYFKNSVVNKSSQRGVVIHGTNGVLVDNNIIYDIQGHGIFTEDAVERRNVINHNLVLHVRNPIWDTQLKNHEQGGLHDGGSSAFWISNPDNTLTNNAAADCIAFGYWLAFTTQAWGDNIGVLHPDGFLLRPNRLKFGVFQNNVAHSVKLRGIMLDLVEVNNEGDVNGDQYYSTSDGLDPVYPFPYLERFTLSESTIYKCGHNGFWDRSTFPNTFGFVSADNCGRFFAGAGAEGRIERNLVVGTSLNHEMNGTGRDVLGWTDFYRIAGSNTEPGSEPVAFASYHHTFVTKDNIVMNFPLITNKRSGAFDMGDYYIRGVEKGQVRNENNSLINAHPGYKAQSPDGWYTFSSAVWDPHGVWGPAGNYLVDNVDFLTYGKTATEIAPGPSAVGAVSVAGPFYSFRGFILYGEGDQYPRNQHYADFWNIHVSRQDNDLNEVATWQVNGSMQGDLFSHMKDFVTSPDGIYTLTFPGLDLPNDFRMLVDNMLTTSDQQVMAIQFDGSVTDIDVGVTAYGSGEEYTEVNNLLEVRNSDGAVYWQDAASNLVWVKIRGGTWNFWTTNLDDAAPSFEDTTYEQSSFYIEPN